MASVRCVNCRVCESVSHHLKPKEVIFCPREGQYRATAIFRRCENFVENFTAANLQSSVESGAVVAL